MHPVPLGHLFLLAIAAAYVFAPRAVRDHSAVVTATCTAIALGFVGIIILSVGAPWGAVSQPELAGARAGDMQLTTTIRNSAILPAMWVPLLIWLLARSRKASSARLLRDVLGGYLIWGSVFVFMFGRLVASSSPA